ncbi:MAG: IS1634 family transposase [Solirubrobacterales bacterium]|nr:IS1634 family transposase [Solirubrobacterales bacterium]
MFVKETTVKRGQRAYTYLQLVDGYRDETGRVRHRVVANLGRKEALKESGQLEALAGSFARLDPPMTGTRREVGALLLAWHFVRELDLVGVVDRSLPRSPRSVLSVGEVAAALICSRLCSPSPLYDVAGWAFGAAVHELLGIPAALLNDDRLGRALETFAVHSEPVRGALAARAIETFGLEVGRLHVDLTTLRVAGAYEDSALIAKGWGSDRHVRRQVRALQAATAEGVSVYWRPDPGNSSELALVGRSLERLAKMTGPAGVLVCDSACGHPKTLAQIQAAGLRYVVPLRASTGFQQKFRDEIGHESLRPLSYLAAREQHLPAANRTQYRGCLRDWTLTCPEDGREIPVRVAWIHSSQEGHEVAAARERALCKAESELARVKRGLGGRYYPTRQHVDKRIQAIIGPNIETMITVRTGTRNGKPTISWTRNQDAIAHAAQTDGIYPLATNQPGRLTALSVLRQYKDQQIVERRHRDAKHTLKVRPIFLHNDDRIHALISIVGLALLIFGLIETRTRHALGTSEQLPGLLPEGRAAIPTGANILAAFQGLGLTYTPAGIRLDRLTHTQRRILDLLQIQPPWPEQDT